MEEEFLGDPWKMADSQRIFVLLIVHSSLEHPIGSPNKSCFHDNIPLPPLATYLLTLANQGAEALHWRNI